MLYIFMQRFPEIPVGWSNVKFSNAFCDRQTNKDHLTTQIIDVRTKFTTERENLGMFDRITGHPSR